MQPPISLSSLASYVRGVIDTVTALPENRFSARHTARLPGLDILAFDSGTGLGKSIDTNLVPTQNNTGVSSDRLTVYLAHPGIAGVEPPAKWDNAPYLPHAIDEALAPDGLKASHFHDLDHWHMYDIKHGVAVQLMAGPDAHPPWEKGAPLRPFLHWYYAERGLRLGHAGTLGVDGNGILLAGAGGSGKSGTVMAGLLHGLQSVGDDYVLLDLSDGVVARPVFSTLKQDPDGYRRLDLSRVAPDPRPLNWQGKYEFTLPEISRVPVPAELRIRALIIPHVSKVDETRIEPIARTEAMMAIAASSIYQMPGERESGFRFFSEITRRLPCYRLDLGRNPAVIAETISEFIQSARA